VSLPNPIRKPLLCYVTDRKSLAGYSGKGHGLLIKKIEAAGRAGVDWIQIREKDMQGRELTELVAEALRVVPRACRVVVNDRLDVAMAAGAGGVHLGEAGLPAEQARRLMRERNLQSDFRVGVSTHSLEAAFAAQQAGADYIIFGPVFPTPSKVGYGSPQGLGELKRVCRSISLPVLAIGGITLENAGACLAAGAGGVVAIRLFQDAADLGAVLTALRRI
jgi:thiamine-phosphate diphosphorylase